MSAGRKAFLFAGAIAFAVGCIWWVIVSGSLWSWLGAPVLLVCAGFMVRTLIRSGFFMILDRRGFSETEGVQHTEYKWSDIGDFAVVKDGINPFETHIGFNLRSRARAAGELLEWRDISLMNTYGDLTVAEGVQLLSQWQARALAEMSSTSSR